MMKFISCLLLFAGSQMAFAEGPCMALPDKAQHEALCSKLDQKVCEQHVGLCTWGKATGKAPAKPKAAAAQKPAKAPEGTGQTCVAKDSRPEHASFCATQDKSTCLSYSICKLE